MGHDSNIYQVFIYNNKLYTQQLSQRHHLIKQDRDTTEQVELFLFQLITQQQLNYNFQIRYQDRAPITQEVFIYNYKLYTLLLSIHRHFINLVYDTILLEELYQFQLVSLLQFIHNYFIYHFYVTILQLVLNCCMLISQQQYYHILFILMDHDTIVYLVFFQPLLI